MADDRLTQHMQEIVRTHRRAKGYSQEYVAALLNVSRQTYIGIEGGKSPVGNDARRLLARGLGIPPSMLGITGGAVIAIPAASLIHALWAQFYSGTAPGMFGIVPHAQLWLDEQPRSASADSAVISQLYQAVTVALRDARMYEPALSAAQDAIRFAEFLSGPHDPNAEVASAYYRRSRVYAAMAENARGEKRLRLLGLAATDAAAAVARAPQERIALRIVALQNLAHLQSVAGAGPKVAIGTILEAFNLAPREGKHQVDATNITFSTSGLYHAAARTYLDLDRQLADGGYLESADDHIGDAIAALRPGEHRWHLDMHITYMEVAARRGNLRDAAEIAPQIAGALDLHQSRRLGGRALDVIGRIHTKGNSTVRARLLDAEQQIRSMIAGTAAAGAAGI